MHTKKMIMESLQDLHNNYDPIIINPMYRGSMEKIPSFTMKQIAEKVGRTVQTIRKWCHVLEEEGLIKMGYKRSYSANDPTTYVVCRSDSKPIKLRWN